MGLLGVFGGKMAQIEKAVNDAKAERERLYAEALKKQGDAWAQSKVTQDLINAYDYSNAPTIQQVQSALNATTIATNTANQNKANQSNILTLVSFGVIGLVIVFLFKKR